MEDTHSIHKTLRTDIEAGTEIAVYDCYQCGKCSAGCPFANDMDYPPSMVLRMLQSDDPALDEKVLRSYAIWLCLACETCIARCPQEVDIPIMMDFLRAESLKRRMVNPRAKSIVAFHRSFLDSIRYTGKLYEIGFIIAYKVRSWDLFQDIFLAPKMFLLGKLGILPHGMKNLSKLFSKFNKKKREASA